MPELNPANSNAESFLDSEYIDLSQVRDTFVIALTGRQTGYFALRFDKKEVQMQCLWSCLHLGPSHPRCFPREGPMQRLLQPCPRFPVLPLVHGSQRMFPFKRQ